MVQIIIANDEYILLPEKVASRIEKLKQRYNMFRAKKEIQEARIEVYLLALIDTNIINNEQAGMLRDYMRGTGE